MNKFVRTSSVAGGVITALLMLGCGGQDKSTPAATSPAIEAAENAPLTLKGKFSDAFLIGTALNREQILDQEAGALALVTEQFNAVTPENVMKWERINPNPGEYHFDAPDQLVAFANAKGLFLVGHTLVWHSQVPEWVFEYEDGSLLNREELLARMRTHIEAVAGRYQGKIEAWDVVNEALNEDGSLRDSKWRQIIGDDYIVQAFKIAAEVLPNARLYYNDYNLFKPEKRQGVIRLVRSLQAQNIRIDGVGLQGHYALDYPDLSQLEDSVKAYAALGVDVMITELDVSVLPFPDEENQGADVSLNIALQEQYNPYPDRLPEAVKVALADRYRQIFEVLHRNREHIGRVTFWGVHDEQSWRNDWPMKGRTDYPLLIDRERQLKPFVTTLASDAE